MYRMKAIWICIYLCKGNDRSAPAMQRNNLQISISLVITKVQAHLETHALNY
jgi:hypothetical protein